MPRRKPEQRRAEDISVADRYLRSFLDNDCVILDAFPATKKPRRRKFTCPDCPDTHPHQHCSECGSTEHLAANCDNMG